MTLRSLILGSAAAIFAVGAAQAADLPMTKAEAVEYVKICTQFGAGFFYIPGSDTCLKISGEVRSDYVFSEMHKRSDDGVGFKVRGKLNFDARTATDYGILRSYINLYEKVAAGGVTTLVVDKAYIQFGGLTAGLAHSFYGFYDNDYGNVLFSSYYADSYNTNLLAYTAAFGGGFTATLSVEDGAAARNKNLLFSDTTSAAVGYAGLTAPDVVGNLRVDQSWGAAEVMGAVHQLRSLTPTIDTKYGYAVGGSLVVKLPVAAGGHIAVEGSYADGALNYLGINNPGAIVSSDWVQSGATAKLSHGWSIAGEAGVNVTKAITINAFGSYADVKVADPLGNGPDSASDASFKSWIAGVNVWYTVVKGFSVGAEIGYTDINYKSPVTEAATLADVKGWTGGLRLKRTF